LPHRLNKLFPSFFQLGERRLALSSTGIGWLLGFLTTA
jgi:hypothetical protein